MWQPWRGIAALVLVAAVLPPKAAWSCVCIVPVASKWRAQAALVFRGRVVNVRQVTWTSAAASARFFSKEVTFSVLERFKGPKASTCRLFTGDCSVSDPEPGNSCFNTCEAKAKVGEEYIVFAFADADGRPALSECGLHPMKTPWSSAKEMLVELRARSAVEQ